MTIHDLARKQAEMRLNDLQDAVEMFTQAYEKRYGRRSGGGFRSDAPMRDEVAQLYAVLMADVEI